MGRRSGSADRSAGGDVGGGGGAGTRRPRRDRFNVGFMMLSLSLILSSFFLHRHVSYVRTIPYLEYSNDNLQVNAVHVACCVTRIPLYVGAVSLTS